MEAIISNYEVAAVQQGERRGMCTQHDHPDTLQPDLDGWGECGGPGLVSQAGESPALDSPNTSSVALSDSQWMPRKQEG